MTINPRRIRLAFAFLVAALIVGACARPEPIRIGFIGGLTGRVADLGQAGRNGFLLAVEQANSAGGINGRPLEAIVKDDAQDAAQAGKVAAELTAARVAAIIGPMTSAMAPNVIAAAAVGGVPVVSPTVTTTDLSGKDDLFLRVISDVKSYAGLSARYHYARNGSRRIAAVFDTRNRSYTETWLAVFHEEFAALGGSMVAEIAFESGEKTDHAELVRQMLATRPDTLLFVSSAVDLVRFAQQARHQFARQKIAGVEWAATEGLVELGGMAVEGVYITQFFDRGGRMPAFLEFGKAFESRFQAPPGFASVAAYDATHVVIEALLRGRSDEPLKRTLLERGPFAGLQQPILFDRFGDTQRPCYMTTVRDGRFVVAD